MLEIYAYPKIMMEQNLHVYELPHTSGQLSSPISLVILI